MSNMNFNKQRLHDLEIWVPSDLFPIYIALNALFKLIPIFRYVIFLLFQCMKISALGSPVTFSRLHWYVSKFKIKDKLDQRN